MNRTEHEGKRLGLALRFHYRTQYVPRPLPPRPSLRTDLGSSEWSISSRTAPSITARSPNTIQPTCSFRKPHHVTSHRQHDWHLLGWVMMNDAWCLMLDVWYSMPDLRGEWCKWSVTLMIMMLPPNSLSKNQTEYFSCFLQQILISNGKLTHSQILLSNHMIILSAVHDWKKILHLAIICENGYQSHRTFLLFLLKILMSSFLLRTFPMIFLTFYMIMRRSR